MRTATLLWLFFRLAALNELAYRANFFAQVVQSGVRAFTALAGLAVIFQYTDTLAGWSVGELLALTGTYILIGGFVSLVIRPSLSKLMESVRLGTLDFALVKPVDAQLLVSVQQVQIWQVVDIFTGTGVLVWGLLLQGGRTGAAQTALFGLTLLAGVAIVYSLLLILASLSFWVVRVDNILVIYGSLYEAGRYPVGIYPRWLRLVLTFLVPVAFAVTVPAEAVLGRLTWPALGTAQALAAGMLVASRLFWRYGLRHYSGASA